MLRRRTLLLLLLWRRQEARKRKKRVWVRKIFQDRKQKGEFHLLLRELKLYDHEYFFKYFRMSPTQYEHFLSLIAAPSITKSSLRRWETIGPSKRLAVTLRYLFTGDAQVIIGTSFRISPTSVGRIVHETCIAIWNVLLANNYIPSPKTEVEWKCIATEFERKWNFHHCIGAIDGKHIVMQAPARSGSLFFNYEKTHSIVLMVVCNANYEFIAVDIGDTGSFPLKENIMKPYSREVLNIKERIFNYRLSRGRRIIENTFGILAARFRIFRRPIIAREEVVINITSCSCLT